LEFHDEGNQQFSLPRQAPPPDTDNLGDPTDITDANADKAFVLLKSGYGIQVRLDDSISQTETQNQYLQLLAPQRSNTERGPHQMVFQENADGPGLVLLRAGGTYYRSSYDDAIEVVGDENNPDNANKFVQVTGNYIADVGKMYFHRSDLTIFQAEKYIFLLAGRDCEDQGFNTPTGADLHNAAIANVQIAAQSGKDGLPNQYPLNKGPCTHPVVVAADAWVCPFTNFVHFGVAVDPDDPTKFTNNSISDRVFASKSNQES